MLQYSQDALNSVQPDTDSCSTHGNTGLERAISYTAQENLEVQLPDDESHQQKFLRLSGSACQVDCSKEPIQALPGITTIINENKQVS